MDIRTIIHEQGLSVFSRPPARRYPSLLQTKDARRVHERVRKKLTSGFTCPATAGILDALQLPPTEEQLQERQEFFRHLPSASNEALAELSEPRPDWRPPYAITAVTEEEQVYNQLKREGVPVMLLLSQHDLEELTDYEIVQVIDCEKFGMHLEQLEQAVFCDSPEDVYLERYLRQLSGWQHNLSVLKRLAEHDDNIRQLIEQLEPLLALLTPPDKELTEELAERTLKGINERLSAKLEETQIPGSDVYSMLESGTLPEELRRRVTEEIRSSGLPAEIFIEGIPVKLDEQALHEHMRRAEQDTHLQFAGRLREYKERLQSVPQILGQLETELLVHDFCGGISRVMPADARIPTIGNEIQLTDSYNLFLKKPEPVSFGLDAENRCSILTGANSGGKTTLIEHLIQAVIMGQYGMPLQGTVTVPLLQEIYYFAKNKGSMNQGAFETLLNQMASIKDARYALILADEIESITEPGVAADIIAASADYFIRRGFYLVFATHLGRELQHKLPEKCRIDGIEAQGLDDSFNLIIQRSPVLGKLASSTPELIIEKLAQRSGDEYFMHLTRQIRS